MRRRHRGSPRDPGAAGWRAALKSIAVLACLAGCAPIADIVDSATNGTVAPRARMAGPAALAVHDRMMVADLHADTLLWRRGIAAREMPRGHVDLPRLVRGNIGLQAFTIATRVPTGDQCIDGSHFDPAGLLAALNGWPAATPFSAYDRALHQADGLEKAAAASASTAGPRLMIIRTIDDLRAWQRARFPAPGVVNRSAIAAVLGLEGSHALNDAVGVELDELYRRGLRMVAPTHRFDNAFGRASEGCGYVDANHQHRGLTALGKRLIEAAIARRMVVDVAHASTDGVLDPATIAGPHRHPLVVSHSGLRSYLETQPACCQGEPKRGSTDQELIAVAQTGGVFGIGFWKEVIGTADVDHIVGAIRHALAVLKPLENRPPRAPGFHTIRRASQHVGLGSDWDGAVTTAIDAGQVALITEGLLAAQIPVDQIADIMGLNVCRALAQSLDPGRLTFDEAIRLCRGA